MSNKKKGILTILLPIVLLFLFLILNTTLTYVQLQLTPEPQRAELNFLDTTYPLWLRIAQMTTTGIAFASIALLLVGIPLGIYLLTRKEANNDSPYLAKLKKSHPKYKNLTDAEIAYVQGWSWPAFLSPTVWALASKMYLWAFLSLIPFVNLYVWIKLSVDGRAMTWEQKEWQNFTQFRARQKIVIWIILVIIVMGVLLEML